MDSSARAPEGTSRLKSTGYEYIPSPGEDYHPQGKSEESGAGTVLHSGTDTDIVRKPNGDVVLTDKNGNRRSQ